MKKATIALAIGAAFERTALETLRGIIGASKAEKHDAICLQVATIAALALAHEAPKGLGNPADHGKLVKAFTDAKMPRYADAVRPLQLMLKHAGMRSCATWEDALTEGTAIAGTMLAPLAPKVRTAAEAKAAEAKSAERKATKAAEAKAAEATAAAEAAAAHEAALSKARAEGAASVTVGAAQVAAMIASGAFDSEGLALIAQALKAAPVGSVREVPALPMLQSA